MRSVHGDKLRCINYSMLCTVRSFRYKVNNTPTYSLSLLWLCPRTVVYDFPARVFRPSAATSNTWRFKQTLSNPGWRVMHTVRSPMASSMTSSQRSISLQQMHSCAFVTICFNWANLCILAKIHSYLQSLITISLKAINSTLTI